VKGDPSSDGGVGGDAIGFRQAWPTVEVVLYEDDATDAVCAELERRCWTIEQHLRSTERGDDIIATRGAQQFNIDCKGETNADARTNRYGKPLNEATLLPVMMLLAPAKSLADPLPEHLKAALNALDTDPRFVAAETGATTGADARGSGVPGVDLSSRAVSPGDCRHHRCQGDSRPDRAHRIGRLGEPGQLWVDRRCSLHVVNHSRTIGRSGDPRGSSSSRIYVN